MSEEIREDRTKAESGSIPDQIELLRPDLYQLSVPPYRQRPGVNWRLIIWGIVGVLAAIVLFAYGQAIYHSKNNQVVEENPGFTLPPTLTPTATPSPIPTALPNKFALIEPTATPTPV